MVGELPGGEMVKNLPTNAGDARDGGSIPGSQRSPREGNGYPLAWKTPRTQEPEGYSPWGRQQLDTTEHIY